MSFKWFGPLALLAALVIGDQIRINRPAHKYRLTVEVETPEGRKSASGVLAVHPDRSYPAAARPARWAMPFSSISGRARTSSRCWRMSTTTSSYSTTSTTSPCAPIRPLRGKRVSFNAMSALTGIVPVTGELVPVLVTFADPADPASARAVAPDDAEAVFGKGYRLQGMTAEVVPNGFWPLDFGGVLGEPVSRAIAAKLPWLGGAGDSAATALRAAGLPGVDGIDAREAFTRK